jgi:hypothetical protein
MMRMNLGEHWLALGRKPAVRTALFLLGLLMMAVAPLVGALPGPGFIILFPLGLALSLKNSQWAKRRYVEFKRWRPKAGSWADWGLRRASHHRREALRKQREALEASTDD